MAATHFRRHFRLFGLAALGLLVLGGRVARAADSIIEDSFSELDSSFTGDDDLALSASGGQMHAQFKKGNLYYRLLYQSALVEDVDFSAKMKMNDPNGEAGNCVGLVFWAKDYSDYYCLELSDSGTYSVYHEGGGKWVTPVSWRSSDAIKTGDGEWNDLRVVCVGKRATLFINGKEVAKIRGAAPEGGGFVGYMVWSGKDQTPTYDISGMKAVEPTEKPSTEKEDPNVVYADKFDALDPGWGVENGWFGAKGGKMTVKLEPNQAYHPVNEGFMVEDVDATAKMQLKNPDPTQNCGIGMTIWCGDYSNDYWNVEVYQDGTASVWRKAKDRWLNPVKAKKIPAEAKFDPTKPFEMRVVTSGKKATAYINGVETLKVNGQPPKGSWQIGFQCDTTEKTGAEFTFWDFVVKKP